MYIYVLIYTYIPYWLLPICCPQPLVALGALGPQALAAQLRQRHLRIAPGQARTQSISCITNWEQQTGNSV